MPDCLHVLTVASVALDVGGYSVQTYFRMPPCSHIFPFQNAALNHHRVGRFDHDVAPFGFFLLQYFVSSQAVNVGSPYPHLYALGSNGPWRKSSTPSASCADLPFLCL